MYRKTDYRKTNRKLYYDRISLLESSSNRITTQKDRNPNNHNHEQPRDSFIPSNSIDQGTSLFQRKVSKPSISELPESTDFQNQRDKNNNSDSSQLSCQEKKKGTFVSSPLFALFCCFLLSLLLYSFPNGIEIGILILSVLLLGLFLYKRFCSSN